MQIIRLTVLFSALASSAGLAQRTYPPSLPQAKEQVYKTVGDLDLKLWVFDPENVHSAAPRPAVVFFFGGGWNAGSPMQFVPQSEYLQKRGMTAIVADYRVASRHKTLAKDCVADARDAMRFLRKNAEELGIDPKRLAAGGGSAGGHIAACLGTIKADAASRPDAMALFNPACVLAPLDGKRFWEADRRDEMRKRMGVDPEALSPAHHVGKHAPPCIVFHGTDDKTVPFATAEAYVNRMKAAGVRCEMKAYEGQSHGFFNSSRKNMAGGLSPFDQTMQELDAFMVELGWLERP